ncbi:MULTISPECIES: peptide chain release factor N(5)-glutamine methyltransferase [Photorhabdus]|uniref:peptide chain release factor N(5)-glutamine methyltransferase n=1 Tax=Photorhabdus TaxID=29487 RepID=UPI000DCD154D|nr:MULTISPECIES: peptide chain release factor N(5)-glutamine methyltransferase [Photorhabdus]MCT8345310.1 peptide chain release factor N(5)-glutamine methyltransferase [Photorhabdus kleinii]RAW93770.1 protein-(glutamine-N5) methyltransferase, release factor-specific [Photorhabdus sp. S9-53]RAW93785.1 protein-(glutamine-N5) methyltransferase, release factor-specific [Photorhabdus sp. S10-54]RAX05371.1 protein-(glutamine-N5) methyltransferase, release factor-specific [Photorhabdus sp. S8-52]
MDYLSWLKQATRQLSASDTPKRDAEILLGFVTHHSRTYILAFGETQLAPEQFSQLETLLARRVKGEPIAYITGEREFWSLPLNVSPATLIPRPDTECLVEKALERLSLTPCHILDLGTGTGAIALAIASERPDCRVTGVDINPDAVMLAQGNAEKLKIQNVDFLLSNWFSSLNNQQFGMIVSNPPYIDETDPHLSQGDVRFEPDSALIAAKQGIADLNTIIDLSRHFLLPGGWLLLEHGWKQGNVVRSLFSESGYRQVATFQDYGGNERITLGQWKSDESHS